MVLRCGLTMLLMALSATAAEAGWTPPAIELPTPLRYPLIACTPAERERLRAAWRGPGPAHDAVAAVVQRAGGALAQPLEFPPRGGQHNQWYQCDRCQVALETVDATHHRCPQCATVYSGPPYDDVLFAARHHQNLQAMLDAAWAWTVTDEAKYADFAKSVLLGYADRYQDYPYHANTQWNLLWRWISGGRLFEQTLGEASSLATRIAPAYDLVHDSGRLSADDQRRIREGLILPMLESIDKYKAGVNNWQSWHNAAFFAGGAVLGDVAWMRKAVLGGGESAKDRLISQAANVEAMGLARPGDSFLFQLEHSVSPDGMWYESSWGYHFYALQALMALADAARRTGTDLWHTPGFANLFTLPARYTMPDGTLPRFGDDVSSSAQGHGDLFEPAYAALGAPELLPMLPSTPTWESVLYGRGPAPAQARATALGSEVFRGAGHAILRTGGPAGLATAFVFGPYGGYHGHLDKLSFVLFGFGQELGVDPGRARSQAYRLPVHGGWYKATLSHNTVLVDGASQAGVAGRLTLFHGEPHLAVAAAECDQAYPGVRHRRAVLQTERYLLVVDELSAHESHRFDWLYHHRGDAVTCAAATEEATLGKRLDGSEYIQGARSGASVDALRVLFGGPAVALHLTLAGAPGTRVTTGTGVGASMTERVPLVDLSREGTRVRFVAVLEPVPAGQAAAVGALTCREGDLEIEITVAAADGPGDAYRIVWGTRVDAALAGRAPAGLPFPTK